MSDKFPEGGIGPTHVVYVELILSLYDFSYIVSSAVIANESVCPQQWKTQEMVSYTECTQIAT